MKILLTGARGTLGRHLLSAPALAGSAVLSPSSAQLDVTDAERVDAWFDQESPDLVIHAAARIRTAGTDSSEQRRAMSRVNVLGTGIVARAAARLGARLVHVSTDFVFDGSKPGGLYTEDDITCPLGYYPLTKAAAEPLALSCPNSLVVRLSFNETWPYPKAFTDRFTSKLPAAEAAAELALAALSELGGVLHIAGPRQTYLEFARSLGAKVEPMTVADVDSADPLPMDTSLCAKRWDAYRSDSLRDA